MRWLSYREIATEKRSHYGLEIRKAKGMTKERWRKIKNDEIILKIFCHSFKISNAI